MLGRGGMSPVIRNTVQRDSVCARRNICLRCLLNSGRNLHGYTSTGMTAESEPPEGPEYCYIWASHPQYPL
eukprot:1176570-Rhodomonas_salina.1